VSEALGYISALFYGKNIENMNIYKRFGIEMLLMFNDSEFYKKPTSQRDQAKVNFINLAEN